nr:uncharacterized protein LOC111425658 isoform X1 [Onthophagus taurus]
MELAGFYGITTVFIFFLQGICIEAVCFFPPEYVGEFVMQKSVNTGNAVEYSTINISFTGTPLWGSCTRRYDNNFIFTTSTDDYLCNNCLNLSLKSRNVLQVRASNLSKCYVKEEDAIESCPKDDATKSDGVVEIILFKTQNQYGPTQKEFCPIDDKYSVKYHFPNINSTNRCMTDNAIVNMCPSASEMSLSFDNCPEGYGFKLSCIGQWIGQNGQHYLALEDSRQQPTYRCALFEKNEKTGIVKLALSRDSTCDGGLETASRGHETMELTPSPQEDSPWVAETENEVCRFPEWLQGQWEHVTVDRNTFVYRDQANFVKYDLRCLAAEANNRYFVHIRAQCGNEKSYSCLWVQQRDDNVFEFLFGLKASIRRDEVLCDESNFGQDGWITQGRKQPINTLRCPISGIFNGVIPESGSFCGSLSSDCKTPDLMYYKVYDCKTSQMYEEREYRCLGHWRENDQLYTYTKRHDSVAVGTFECFVGSIVTDDEDYIIIREAGVHCERKMEGVLGMKLTKQKQLTKTCVEPEFETTIFDDATLRPVHPKIKHSTMRPSTKPNTDKPTHISPSGSSSGSKTNVLLSLALSIVIIIY